MAEELKSSLFALELAEQSLQAQEEHIRSLDSRYGAFLSVSVLIIAVLVGLVDGTEMPVILRVLYLGSTASMFLAVITFFYGFVFLRTQRRAPDLNALGHYLDDPVEDIGRAVFGAMVEAWTSNGEIIIRRVCLLKIGGFFLVIGSLLLGVLLVCSGFQAQG